MPSVLVMYASSRGSSPYELPPKVPGTNIRISQNTIVKYFITGMKYINCITTNHPDRLRSCNLLIERLIDETVQIVAVKKQNANAVYVESRLII
jgi:hypothetical protein